MKLQVHKERGLPPQKQTLVTPRWAVYEERILSLCVAHPRWAFVKWASWGCVLQKTKMSPFYVLWMLKTHTTKISIYNNYKHIIFYAKLWKMP